MKKTIKSNHKRRKLGFSIMPWKTIKGTRTIARIFTCRIRWLNLLSIVVQAVHKDQIGASVAVKTEGRRFWGLIAISASSSRSWMQCRTFRVLFSHGVSPGRIAKCRIREKNGAPTLPSFLNMEAKYPPNHSPSTPLIWSTIRREGYFITPRVHLLIFLVPIHRDYTFSFVTEHSSSKAKPMAIWQLLHLNQ